VSAIILKHPAYEVKLEPPDGYAMPQPGISDPISLYAPEHPTQEQWNLLDAHEAIWKLIGIHGARQLYAWTRRRDFVNAPIPLIVLLGRYDVDRVSSWIRNLGIIAGQDVDGAR